MMTLISSLAAFSYVILSVLVPSSLSRPLLFDQESKNLFMIRIKGSDLIENTCKNTPNYELCVSTLQSDPRSFDADVAGLGLVVVYAVKAKATSAVDTINKMKMSNPEYSRPLYECSFMYYAVLKADIPEAIEALTKGVPKFAEAGMDDTAVEVQGCENSFKQANSPLSDINKAVYDLSLVAKSIIRMLL